MRLLVLALFALCAAAAEPGEFAAVRPDTGFNFPGDFGSHPDYRTEWWYVTGWLDGAHGPLGFQITFFRSRPPLKGDNPSAFTPRQIFIAHCALSDPSHQRLWQDQRVRRAGFNLADADLGDTRVWIESWHLERRAGAYLADIDAADFSLHLRLTPTQPPLLNGEQGFSRKGPLPTDASHYYSIPHLAVDGSAQTHAKTEAVSGEAWLDHEWSSEYLDPQAVGWDWIGLNLDRDAALMAFRIRSSDGKTLWAGGTYRAGSGEREAFGPEQIEFTATRSWTSPRTGISYPVEWRVQAGSHQLQLQPLLDDQENDTRLSTGAIYWEGAVRALDPQGQPRGRGYLELTGYGEPLHLR